MNKWGQTLGWNRSAAWHPSGHYRLLAEPSPKPQKGAKQASLNHAAESQSL